MTKAALSILSGFAVVGLVGLYYTFNPTSEAIANLAPEFVGVGLGGVAASGIQMITALFD